MTRAAIATLSSVVLAAAGCNGGTSHPSDASQDDTNADGSPTELVPWSVRGVQWMTQDTTGDLWMGGTIPDTNGNDGWAARVDPVSGDVGPAGIRSFGVHPTYTSLFGAVRSSQLVVVGEISENGTGAPAVGEIRPDGEWDAAWRLGGFGDATQLVSGVARDTGELVLVGRTEAGAGGCSGCSATDAFVVKLGADRSVEWARAIGSSSGEEKFTKIVALPTGDLIAFGGVYVRDYGGGDIASAPAFIVRMTSSGTLVWARWLRVPTERNGRLFDGVYDPSFDGVVIVGSMDGVPVLLHVRSDGTVLRGERVVLQSDPQESGDVSAVALADDGGLYLVGERYDGLYRTYIAKLGSSRQTFDWSFESGRYSRPLVFDRDDQILPLKDGGVIVRALGDTMRLDPSGTVPNSCPHLSQLARQLDLGLAPLVDNSIDAPSIVVTNVTGGTAETRTGHATGFSNPVYPMRCY